MTGSSGEAQGASHWTGDVRQPFPEAYVQTGSPTAMAPSALSWPVAGWMGMAEAIERTAPEVADVVRCYGYVVSAALENEADSLIGRLRRARSDSPPAIGHRGGCRGTGHERVPIHRRGGTRSARGCNGGCPVFRGTSVAAR